MSDIAGIVVYLIVLVPCAKSLRNLNCKHRLLSQGSSNDQKFPTSQQVLVSNMG